MWRVGEELGPVVRRRVRDASQRREEWRERFGVQGRRVLLITGGSQGADALDRAMRRVERWRQEWVVWHQARAEGMQEFYEQRGVEAEVRPFFADLGERIACADVVVCRAGAGTVAELRATGTPAIVVPYPYAGGHQRANAEALRREGRAVVVEQREGWENALAETLETWMRTPPGRCAPEQRAGERELAEAMRRWLEM